MWENHRIGDWLEWRVASDGAEVRLKRFRGWIAMVILAFLLLGFLGWEVLLIYGWVKMFREAISWKLVIPPAFGAAFGFCIFLLCKVIPSVAMTKVRFLMDRNATEVTYLGVTKRLIPDLPDHISVTSRTGSMGARLCYSRRSFEINLGGFDTDNDEGHERELALRKTSKLRDLLKVEVQIDGNK